MMKSMNQTSRRDFLSYSAAALSSAALSPISYAAEKKLNVVVILVDDYGWTDAACTGSALFETPNIDALASQGMRFTNGYAACTVCSPTRASILTGKYPARLHLTDWIAGHKKPWAKLKVPDFNLQLPHDEVTIAEALKPHGYTSASIGKWHLGGEKFYPESQGFDLNIAGTHRGQPPRYFAPYKIPTLEEGPDGEYLTDRMAQEAVQFIESNKDNPFFLYLPLFAVHTPIQGKKNYTDKYKENIKPWSDQRDPQYAAMVNSVDDAVGSVLQTLDRLNLTDDTLVIFTGDNGGLVPKTNNSPLRMGKGSPYEGGTRVPLMIRWPGKVRAGSVTDVPAISADFFPTVMSALDIDSPVKENIDGVDLLPVLTESGSVNREALYWHYPHYHPGGSTPYGAIRKGDWKLLEFFEDGRLELYNLKNDLSEKFNLANLNIQKRDELHQQLVEWRQSVNAQMPTSNPNYKPEWANDHINKHKDTN
ncbi:MAG: sulfatase [Candidatus Hinthialibacter antarcticus]|nr:sulfatase [Candidatus Hinthialibacter antarcticus]